MAQLYYRYSTMNAGKSIELIKVAYNYEEQPFGLYVLSIIHISGAPIVQMLVQENITNIVVVVTRYFGGIKLGTGGLVRAYTSSAKLGIQAAGPCDVKELSAVTYRRCV